MCENHAGSIGDMPKTYAPSSVEERIYANWEAKGYFHSTPNPDKEPYCVVMPPPNVTGQLHMGHALDAMQDVIVRYKRMRGYETLWLPGTDHASIATEVKVVSKLASEGKTKQDIGREAFLEEAWSWKNEYGGRIVKQLRKLGASCDWARERFTMDEGCSKAVTRFFVELYNKGLIYRGDRIVNWCPHCKTAISNAEVDFEEKPSHLWHVRYMAPDGSYSITCATTRPETILGDTGIAVNPNDPRYTGLVGKTVVVPVVGREIPIVADEYVEMDFGTGAVKITPCHDPNDFEVGQRTGLPGICVFTTDGHINELGGRFEGLTTQECREQFVEALRECGALVKIEPYTHNVGTCYRCHTVIEPMISKQWFVAVDSLAKPALKAVEDGRIKFVPERYAQTYYNWMRNIRDWCISRQLWWGHRIPAYYCDSCGETVVAETAPDRCPKCGGHMRQDEDVLDTWFSSGMWPFSTLGWPDKTEELEYYYPTATLATGYDIIFFWVARMVMFGLCAMDDIPFHTVYIHGMVRDEQGRKMSKSLNNGIDPLEIVREYGADSLRFSLVSGTAAGTDMRYSPQKVEAARNFCNKIYNASRFVMMNLGDGPIGEIDAATLDIADKWILHRLNEVIAEATVNIDSFDLNLAVDKVYSFIWNEFCDWYIEMAKPRLYGEDEAAKKNVRAVLVHVLSDSMKLLHPFMPFITEYIYTRLPDSDETIVLSSWPEPNPAYRFEREADGMDGLMDLVRSIRNIRAEMNVPPAKRARITIVTTPEHESVCREAAPYLNKLAGASTAEVCLDKEGIAKDAVSVVSRFGEAYIPMNDLIDIARELERLNKEKARWESEAARANGKLSNQGFMAKAPEKIVLEEKAKLENALAMLAKVEARIGEIKG